MSDASANHVTCATGQWNVVLYQKFLSRKYLIDTPVKQMAVDVVGPIKPTSSEGHRYMLVYYATRYPEAVPFEKDHDWGCGWGLYGNLQRAGHTRGNYLLSRNQFMSDCMHEVSRLLSLKQLTTTPYHPMNYGLVEKLMAPSRHCWFVCVRRSLSSGTGTWVSYCLLVVNCCSHPLVLLHLTSYMGVRSRVLWVSCRSYYLEKESSCRLKQATSMCSTSANDLRGLWYRQEEI